MAICRRGMRRRKDDVGCLPGPVRMSFGPPPVAPTRETVSTLRIDPDRRILHVCNVWTFRWISSWRPRARIGQPVDPTVSCNPSAQRLCLFDETRRPCAKCGCKERCARCNVPCTVRVVLARDLWCTNVQHEGSTSYVQSWCAAPGIPSCTESNPSGDLALPRRTIVQISIDERSRPLHLARVRSRRLHTNCNLQEGVSEVSQDIQSAAKGRVRFPRRYIQLVLRANDAWMGGKSPIHPMRMAE